jgi:hypothetical protein
MLLRTFQDVHSVDAYAAGVSGRGRASDAKLFSTMRRFFEDVSDPEDGICVVRGVGRNDVWVIADGPENFLYVMAPDGTVSDPTAAARGWAEACARAFEAGASVVRFPVAARRPWPLGAIVAAVRRAACGETPACEFVEVGYRRGMYAAHRRELESANAPRT